MKSFIVNYRNFSGTFFYQESGYKYKDFFLEAFTRSESLEKYIGFEKVCWRPESFFIEPLENDKVSMLDFLSFNSIYFIKKETGFADPAEAWDNFCLFIDYLYKFYL